MLVRFTPWLFFAAAFQSLFPAAALALIPSEGGVSSARLVLWGFLLLCFLSGSFAAFAIRRKNLPDGLKLPALILSALLFLASGLILFSLRYFHPAAWLPYYQRLSPLLWYLLAVSGEFFIFFALLHFGFRPQALAALRPIYRSAALAFLILLAVFFFIALTKIGVAPDRAYWGEPGVPILGWHFALSIFIGFAALLSAHVQPSTLRLKFLSLNFKLLPLQPFLLYLAAVVLWLSVPVSVLQNSFYAPINPPTNLPLPYSDAGFYDYLAQSLLIGADYLGGIPPRPLYVTFLAALHFLFGQNYPALIAAQTFVLALFPVALYFLAKKLHSPAAGATVALFATFREWAALTISSNARVANSKIFTTDFPTALALVCFTLVALWWLERRDAKSTLIAGGAFGLTLLFRTQSLFVLFAVFALAWFIYQRKFKDWFLTGVLFALPMLLVVAPWLTHNYLLTGKFTFDDPKQIAVIYGQYSFDENLNLSAFDPATSSVGGRMLSFTLQNPGVVANFAASHFLNTEIGSLLALPLIKPFNGLFEPLNLYWLSWNGSLEWFNAALLIFYLAVIAVGLAAAWRRAGWLGLLPLAVNVGYALSNAIARFSSWRYNLPVDWLAYFYFGLGAMELLGGIMLPFGGVFSPVELAPQAPRKLDLQEIRPRHLILLLSFILIGALPWLAKGVVSPRYTASEDELLRRAAESGYDQQEIRAFLAQPEANLVEGLILYPRMYRRDEGMASAHPWAVYQPLAYPRLAFLLINARRYDMVFPTKEILPVPQGADATALACKTGDYYEVRLLLVDGQAYQSAPLTKPCSP
ncbi:MAG: hypothetical protein Fur002_18520 [Anaerolineales bacterium]